MLQAGFISLTIALALLIYSGASKIALKAIPDMERQRHFIVRTALLIIVWICYISALSVTGFFTVAALPPRIPIFLVLPAFLFMAYFFASGRFKSIIVATPVHWLINLQAFRIIVELLIWGLFLKGILPGAATFEGYNFDILIGLTAPLIAYFYVQKQLPGKSVLILWNLAGLATLAIVVFILISHAYFPGIWHYRNDILGSGLGIFPYTFLAGFFMPLAVFLHVFTIIRLSQPSE